MADSQRTKYILSYSIQDQNISNIKPYLQILNTMPNIRHLSFKKNNIQQIPIQILQFQTLEEIDLSENKLRDSTLDILKDLKKLKYLHMTIDKRYYHQQIKSIMPQLQYLNGESLYTLNDKFNHVNWEPINLSVESKFLVEIANIYELINNVLLNDGTENSINHFIETIKAELQKLSMNLSQCENKGIRAMIFVRTRTKLQKYCILQLLEYIKPINIDFKILLQNVLRMQWKEYEEMEKIVYYQMNNKIDQEKLLLSKEITRLQETISQLQKQNYFLRDQNRDLEKDNSEYLDKLISYSKGNILSLNGLQLSKQLKDKDLNFNITNLNSYSNPEYLYEPKKLLEQNQLEDIIADIYDKKAKHEAASQKKSTLFNFIKTYFKTKLGSPISNSNETHFVQSLVDFSSKKFNHSILLFTKIMNSECEENYINEVKIIYDNMMKRLKLYISSNQKKIEYINNKKYCYEDIQKIVDQKSKLDIKVDVDGLRMILSEFNFSEEQIDQIIQTARNQRLQEQKQKRQRQQKERDRNKRSGKDKDRQRQKQKQKQKQKINLNMSLNKSNSFSNMGMNKSVLLRMNSLPNEMIQYQYQNYKKVINILLNIHLNKHLEKIKQFVILFRQKDTNNDGQITETQFKEMVLEITDNSMYKDTVTDDKKNVTFDQVYKFIYLKPKKKKKTKTDK